MLLLNENQSMLTSVIIDDKPANVNLLKQLLNTYCPRIEVTGTANNIADGYSCINTLQPDVIFLDIEMPNGSGFELLHKFKDISFEVIFTTAYNQYAIQAFRENALDYLLKPIDIDALQQAVIKAEKISKLKQTNERLTRYLQQAQTPAGTKIGLPVQDGYLYLNYQDIIRCEASGSYTNIFTADGKKIMVSMRLKECEELLPEKAFFRVHHSHVVNLQYITRYVRGRGGYVLMQDNVMVEVAASKKDAFLEIMRQQHT